jgi:hypothetical protein
VADIFVSFTKSDKQWAHWIAQELRALDHEPHVHDWEIGPGEDILGWMEKRHDQADYVLCVVSPDYLYEDKAPFSTLERRAALWRVGTRTRARLTRSTLVFLRGKVAERGRASPRLRPRRDGLRSLALRAGARKPRCL